MQKIPKCKTKFIIPQPNYLKISKKEQLDDNINNNASKISQKKLKFSIGRRFGKDITNSIKENVQNNLIEASMKSINVEKSTHNNIYIKKHSSVSQVNQKEHQNLKIHEKKIQENKSGIMISKKAHSTSVFNNNKNNNKREHLSSEMNNNNNKKSTKLHNAISFGCNNVTSEQINDSKYGKSSFKNMSLNINCLESVSKNDLNNNRDLM